MMTDYMFFTCIVLTVCQVRRHHWEDFVRGTTRHLTRGLRIIQVYEAMQYLPLSAIYSDQHATDTTTKWLLKGIVRGLVSNRVSNKVLCFVVLYIKGLVKRA